jgi:MFS family permease
MYVTEDTRAVRLMRTREPYTSSPLATAGACSESLDEVIEVVGYGRYQRRLLVLTAFTQVADATELMLMSYLTSDAVWCATPWSTVPGSQQLVSSCVFAGMLVGALGIGLLSDECGRRTGYVCALLLTGVGGLIAAGAESLATLAAMRFLVGVGAGGAPAALSLYTEFLPVARRGSHLILFLLFFSLGTLLEAVLAWLVLPSAWGWRGLLALSAAPSLLLLLCTPLLPESPRYLLLQHQPQRALRMLRVAARVNGRAAAFDALGATAALSALAPPLAAAAAAAAAPEQPWRQRLSARGAEGAAQLKARLAALFGCELRWTTLPLCALFFLMAYVYYGLVLLQPSLVAAVLTPTAPNASAACGAAPIDYAGNVVTAAGAPPHLATAERALSLSPTPQPIQTNSQPSHEPLLPSPSPHPAQPSPSAGELPGLALAAFLLERLGRRRTIAFFFVASAVLTWLL